MISCLNDHIYKEWSPINGVIAHKIATLIHVTAHNNKLTHMITISKNKNHKGSIKWYYFTHIHQTIKC